MKLRATRQISEVELAPCEGYRGRFLELPHLISGQRLDLLDEVGCAPRVDGGFAQHVLRVQVLDAQESADHVEDAVSLQVLLDLVDLLKQLMENAALLRVHCNEVEDVDFAVLADAVDSPHPLLEAVWVPRYVVVDHQVTELEVHALACGVGRDADLRLLVEDPAALLAIHRVVAAMDRHDSITPRGERAIQMLERVTVLREDQELPAALGQLLELGLVEAALQALQFRLDRWLGVP